jgi:hypothetical protein
VYLKNDKLIITLGELTITSYNTDLPCFTVDPTAIVGWTDGADVRRNVTNRPTSYGDFPQPALNGSRLITVTGTAVADSVVRLKQMRDTFIGILSDGVYKQLTVTDTYGPRWAMVDSGSRPNWVQQNDTSAVWKMDLYAPDPRIYGMSKTLTLPGAPVVGGLSYDITYPMDYGMASVNQYQYLNNAGNSASWPVFKITGDYFAGFTITDNLGNVITYSGSVSRSAPVTIDPSTGSATQNGSDRSTFITSRQWFSIPPNSTILPSFSPAQSVYGWCDIIYSDTWI